MLSHVMYINIAIIAAGLLLSYIILIVLIDILLRGFSPFIAARPWTVDKMFFELDIDPDKMKTIYSFLCGKSGFLHRVKNICPDARRIGVEYQFYPFLIAMIQKILRNSGIVVLKENLSRVDVRDADLIYCHVELDEARDLGKKFKFECKPGAKIISNGVPIPNLEIKQAFNLDDRPGRFAWLSKNRHFYQSSSQIFKRVNRVYIYEID